MEAVNTLDRQSATCLETCLRLVPAMRRLLADIEGEVLLSSPPNDGYVHMSKPRAGVGNSTQRKAVVLASDLDLRLLRRRLFQVDCCTNLLGPRLRAVCDLLFWSRFRDENARVLARQLGVVDRTLFRFRRSILEHFMATLEAGWDRPVSWWGLTPPD